MRYRLRKQSSDELGLGGMKGDEGGFPTLWRRISQLQTQANILQSDTLALKVIQNLGLEHTADFEPTFNPFGWLLDLISPTGPPILWAQAWKMPRGVAGTSEGL